MLLCTEAYKRNQLKKNFAPISQHFSVNYSENKIISHQKSENNVGFFNWAIEQLLQNVYLTTYQISSFKQFSEMMAILSFRNFAFSTTGNSLSVSWRRILNIMYSPFFVWWYSRFIRRCGIYYFTIEVQYYLMLLLDKF